MLPLHRIEQIDLRSSRPFEKFRYLAAIWDPFALLGLEFVIGRGLLALGLDLGQFADDGLQFGDGLFDACQCGKNVSRVGLTGRAESCLSILGCLFDTGNLPALSVQRWLRPNMEHRRRAHLLD
jgi:hypothetical protein